VTPPRGATKRIFFDLFDTIVHFGSRAVAEIEGAAALSIDGAAACTRG